MKRKAALGLGQGLTIWELGRRAIFIFRDLGAFGNYFRGAGEQAHTFVDLGNPAK